MPDYKFKLDSEEYMVEFFVSTPKGVVPTRNKDVVTIGEIRLNFNDPNYQIEMEEIDVAAQPAPAVTKSPADFPIGELVRVAVANEKPYRGRVVRRPRSGPHADRLTADRCVWVKWVGPGSSLKSVESPRAVHVDWLTKE